MDATRFNAVASVVAVVGPTLALVAAVAFGPSLAFQGSIAVSAVVTLVFAAHNFRAVSGLGSVSFASAAVTALLGVWLAVAPVIYDAGFLATAITQLGGLLTATFAAHAALDVVGRALSPTDEQPQSGGEVPAGLGEVED